jgi:uroporphyrinogen-III synthase
VAVTTRSEAAAALAEQPLAGFTVGVAAERRRTELATLLARCGAHVLQARALQATSPPDDPAPPHRVLPGDRRPLERLIQAACAGEVDAIAFTQAPAVVNLFTAAAELDRASALARAFHNGMLAACVGPACAEPLDRLGIPSVRPARPRLGTLVRTLAEELPARRERSFVAAGHRFVLHGRLAIVDGRPVRLPPTPAAVLQALAVKPGRVLSHSELGEIAWRDGAGEGHTVEAAIARLRRALGPGGSAVQTVIKRGYRLAIDDLPG